MHSVVYLIGSGRLPIKDGCGCLESVSFLKQKYNQNLGLIALKIQLLVFKFYNLAFEFFLMLAW